jgi:serine/threonine protein kinase
MKSIPKMKMIRREDRLRCELEIMSRVHHRNVLRLLDWGFGTYHIYLVMEM